jgi:hypothetical protein
VKPGVRERRADLVRDVAEQRATEVEHPIDVPAVARGVAAEGPGPARQHVVDDRM